MANKIAPTLQHFTMPGVILAPDSMALRQARRELRALLAVARAAKRLRFSPGVVTGDPIGLERALARLDRAGKGGGEP